MILDALNYEIDGNKWEELCIKGFRLRYSAEHFTDVPARHQGDSGLDGFTKNGIVFQCYCPEGKYDDDSLYEHLRTKLSKDIQKLLLPKNIKSYSKMGIEKIKEWHYVIPLYKDDRILKHAKTKQKEIRDFAKKNSPCHIDENFEVWVKIADDFAEEFTRLIRQDIVSNKFRVDLTDIEINLSELENDKVNNIDRKVRAIINSDNENAKADNSHIEQMVNHFIDYYVKGVSMFEKFRLDAPEIYEELFLYSKALKKDVAIKTGMLSDSKKNSEIFLNLCDEFEKRLLDKFTYVEEGTISDLRYGLVSEWLADCSMEFRGGDSN
ncbi:hypothetical protein [Candidatus Enterococcus ferrettii]|uniref:Restriction endonuclease n=1 Tax=Candidatus Enterococcus ferrettii TaxID=2815324 RepID=A0ABV0ETD5_9ENTE|nr:hypothetical protein [Enterococcus sp. 665A]MBO1338914.1 hypothetical protein [Enterococcus sp. 665A]